MSSKKSVLVTSYNLEIGGIERSLIGLLGSFDYANYEVDLLLYNHQGPFLALLPAQANLLPERPEYATAFRNPLSSVFKEGNIGITAARVAARIASKLKGWQDRREDQAYLYGQKVWLYALPRLPHIEKRYDLGISFSYPHYCITDRVNARKRIGWIHTDFQSTSIDERQELKMCKKLDFLAAVSEECRAAYIGRFPELAEKTIVIENILSSKFVLEQANEFDVATEMPFEHGLTRILTVGRFTHQKAIDEAVIACRALIDCGYNIKWYAIGYGPDELMIRQLIKIHGLEARFIILGKKTNPYPYIRACDLFVQPSRYEGKAVTVREAQMLGKPVLITRYLTAGSQVEEGVDGHICSPGVDGVVAGVRVLLDESEYRKRLAVTAASRDYSNRSEIEKIYLHTT